VQHICFVPTPPLAEFIERFWYSSEAPVHQKVRIVPSGTMELVFNLDEDELGIYDTEQPGSYKSFSGAFFSGTYARPLFVDTREHVMGVHFKPGGAFRFLGVPANELTDIHVDLEALWGRADLREHLCAAATPARRIRILESALLARLENTSEEHRAVRAALDIITRNAGEARIRDLAAHLGLSHRHFIKAFSNQVGVTPKLFARVQRFQRAADLTRSSSTTDWADIATACGYFDQSHLIHDFRTFSGLSPSEFHRQRNERLLTSPPINGAMSIANPSII
jgi:AraC-like DNA-binding protein